MSAVSASDAVAEDKLGALLDTIVGRISGDAHWGMTVLAQELVAPSVHMAVLRDEEVPPKFLIVLRILSEITGIPPGAPELACCLISVAAPCAMLLIAGEHLPTSGRDILQVDRRALAVHLHRFALAGLHAAGQDYRSRHEDHVQLST